VIAISLLILSLISIPVLSYYLPETILSTRLFLMCAISHKEAGKIVPINAKKNFPIWDIFIFYQSLGQFNQKINLSLI